MVWCIIVFKHWWIGFANILLNLFMEECVENWHYFCHKYLIEFTSKNTWGWWFFWELNLYSISLKDTGLFRSSFSSYMIFGLFIFFKDWLHYLSYHIVGHKVVYSIPYHFLNVCGSVVKTSYVSFLILVICVFSLGKLREIFSREPYFGFIIFSIVFLFYFIDCCCDVDNDGETCLL